MTRNPIERSAVLTIFDALSHGPRSVAEMPRAWPVTRAVLRAVVRRLQADGLVEPAGGVASPRVQLTARGHAAAAELPTTHAEEVPCPPC
jgi:DNA-binding FadR family transcriptional regulator